MTVIFSLSERIYTVEFGFDPQRSHIVRNKTNERKLK